MAQKESSKKWLPLDSGAGAPRQPCASSLALQLSRSLAMVAMDKLPGCENIF